MLFAKLKICTIAALVCLLTACQTAPISTPTPPSTGSAPEVVFKRPPKIGLALGGGAARGFAHVGVIAALEEAGIKPDLVVGTSAGSLVAAIYASGKTAAQLQEVALKME
jgi:NTE family protein